MTPSTVIVAVARVTGLGTLFPAEKLWAGGLLLGALALTWWGLHAFTVVDSPATGAGGRTRGRPGGLVIGKDGRLSTSRAIALLWTLAIGYCLLTIVLIALSPVSHRHPVPTGTIPPLFVQHALAPLAPQYLIAFGGPFAAAVIARVVTGQKVSNGTLQKAPAARSTPLDLVSDDQGDLDLVDLQYTLFNFVAVVYVVSQFLLHPRGGIPEFPAAFTALTGTSALLYTGNKGFAKNPLSVTRVVPRVVAAGSSIEVQGSNLVVGGAHDESTRPILILVDPDGIEASCRLSYRPGRRGAAAMFTVPQDVPPGDWLVEYASDAGVGAMLDEPLTVVAADASPSATMTAVPDDGSGVDLQEVS